MAQAPLSGPSSPVSGKSTSGLADTRWLYLLLGLIVLQVAVYFNTYLSMGQIWWRSETFSHGFLIFPIAAWLIWRKRQQLAPLQPRPLPWVLLPMASLALLWWLGHLVNVAAAMQLALVAMLVASVVTQPSFSAFLWAIGQGVAVLVGKRSGQA